jgi:hypothetical protein
MSNHNLYNRSYPYQNSRTGPKQYNKQMKYPKKQNSKLIASSETPLPYQVTYQLSNSLPRQFISELPS